MYRHPIRYITSLLIFSAVLTSTAWGQQKATSLFDGKSLDGWEVISRDQRWWTVSDGALTGGSLTTKVPHNTFISTKESFQNFDFTCKIRVQGAGGFINSGIQIRSVRVPNNSEMSGYQVDAGDGWWGKLYDESRRNKVVGQAADLKAVAAAVRANDWNEFRILAEGKRIRSWINGVAALDYTEQDAKIALDGHIGFQAHGGGKVSVQVKDVTIKRLPPTPGAATWPKNKLSQGTPNGGAGSPAAELQGFAVPEGFEVELVASESEGIGKFVAVAFDAGGRMWTMTAMEYPIDANENAAESAAMFAKGGRDKVLVFDKPFGKEVSKPRVFADGLVMPLGVLPYKDGAYVQYGHDIRFYRDTNNDGKADTHEVILTGFGTQDSHLFPHQFTRAPGGWILTAQGLFNSSKVRRPNGEQFASGLKEVPFLHCKLGRFTPTGDDFESLTAGPNNIWGLTISREGETWIQEANDIGYPIIPYEPGQLYATGSRDRLRSYQPKMPPSLAPPQMGGTGLSGLALADDLNSRFSLHGKADLSAEEAKNGAKIFYVANPITSRIQMIRATPQGERYRYEKLSDFLISKDRNFRPVAIQFGPDGCLYVTDWYNKVISHNEVPRKHPERDKTSGRIWRIRHKSQARVAPPVLSELSADELLAHLGSPNARIADLAWQEITDRKAVELAPKLELLIADSKLSGGRRLGALWALEGLKTVPTPLLVTLSSDFNANIRHEAVRIAGAQTRGDGEFLQVAKSLVEDPAPKVRAALGDALRRVPCTDPQVVDLMMQLGKAPLPGNSWEAYDRHFERYMARWAMERNVDAVAAFLKSPQGEAMPLENRTLATLALEGRLSAVAIAQLMPELKRPLTQDELRTLASHFNAPAVATAMRQLLDTPASRNSTLGALLRLRTSLDTKALLPAIESATQSLWTDAKSSEERLLALQVVGGFRLDKLDKSIAQFASSADTTPQLKLAALRSLRELGSTQVATLAKIASSTSDTQPVRDAALATLAESSSEDAIATLGGLLSELDYQRRKPVIARMAMSRSGALALLDAVDEEEIASEDLTPAILETMLALLPDNKHLNALWKQVAAKTQRVLQLSGGNADFPLVPITLTGPFTVETWIRLKPGIDNADGILGSPKVLDMNFFGETFRVCAFGKVHDVVIAKRPTLAGPWTHFAVTRDAAGSFFIYINGELSAKSVKKSTATFANLNIGRTTPDVAGTEGQLAEYRVWNVARQAQQIRDNFDRSFAGEARPKGLVHYFAGADWGKLSGSASVQPTLNAPALLTAEQAKKQAELFAKYRHLAERSGDVAKGKTLFTKNCLVCHQQGGTGGNIGPALDGIGLKETESLLRNILTPSAAMEGGYRNYRVLTRNGRIEQGLLVSQDASAIVLRQPDTADKRIAKSEIAQAGFTKMSVMPNGLLDALAEQEVSDLFSYLQTLRPAEQKDGSPK